MQKPYLATAQSETDKSAKVLWMCCVSKQSSDLGMLSWLLIHFIPAVRVVQMLSTKVSHKSDLNNFHSWLIYRLLLLLK